MKKGFTLVELSIVLVIVGLLIGGILIGQSMISTAKITQQIRQIQQIEIAVRNFKTKYNSLPGDSRQFTTNGNGDGKINGSQPGNLGDWGDWEFKRAFNHMAQANVYDFATYNDNDNSVATVPGLGYPLMILRSKSVNNPNGYPSGIVVGWEDAISYVQAGHKIKLGACSGFGGAYSGYSGFGYVTFNCGVSTNDTQALDSKLDDGKPYSGNAYISGADYAYYIPGSGNSDSTTSCGTYASNTYKVATNGTCAWELNVDF